MITPADVKLPLGEAKAPAGDGPELQDLLYREAKEQQLMAFNSRYIGELLSQTKGNVSQAARRCGLERQALQQIMRRYQINADDYRSTD